MPSKVYEIMASGRPVLASAEAGSDLRRLVVDTQCGVCVEPHDARQLAKAILALRANPRLRRRMGERGRRVVEVGFSTESVVNRYDNLLRSIGQERKRAWQSLRLPRLG
jgi:colanic acid biosynthesis glycosyl transferase WcaI